MTQLLQSKGLWPMLDAEQPKFTRDYENFVHRCKMDEAKGLIGLHVSDNLLFHISECKTPKNVWDKLEELYGKTNHSDPCNFKQNYNPSLQMHFLQFNIFLHNSSWFCHS